MAENLTIADVSAYTGGRLPATGDGSTETQRMLDDALARARGFCGWHVSPVQSTTVNIDGSGYEWIVLPTLKIVSITSVKEDGETLDVSGFRVKSNEPGVLYWRDRCWDPCSEYEITFTHGFAAAEAADFRGEVLRLIDATSLTIGTGGVGPATGVEVDDVSIRFSGITDRSWGIAKNPLLESVLYQYRLLPIA